MNWAGPSRTQGPGTSPIDSLVEGIRASAGDIDVIRLFDGKGGGRVALDGAGIRDRLGFTWRRWDGAGHRAHIEFRNEYLALTLDDVPRAVTPDLICIVDSDTAEPIPTPDVRYGQRVTALGLSCHPVFQTEQALKVVGPEAFGMKTRVSSPSLNWRGFSSPWHTPPAIGKARDNPTSDRTITPEARYRPPNRSAAPPSPSSSSA